MTEKTTEGHGNLREGQQAQGEFGKIPLKIINSFYQTAGLAALWVRVSKASSLFLSSDGMVLVYSCLQGFHVALLVLFCCAWIFMSCKDLNDSKVVSRF
jgi:hypothetical protein